MIIIGLLKIVSFHTFVKHVFHLEMTRCYYYSYCFCEQKGNNIILMGSPGAGKTTVGRILGHHLGKEVIDVDDDVLEKVWGISVAEKVQPSE